MNIKVSVTGAYSGDLVLQGYYDSFSEAKVAVVEYFREDPEDIDEIMKDALNDIDDIDECINAMIVDFAFHVNFEYND